MNKDVMTHDTVKSGLIPEEWLMDYAAGTLNAGHDLLVATHVGYHPDLQKKVATFESAAGALMADLPKSSVRADALENIFARIDTDTDAKDEAGDHGSLADVLNHHLRTDFADVKWKLMGPGMRNAKLWGDDNGTLLTLMKVKGGTVIPEHDHRCTELTLVLKGAYKVGDTHFTPGLIEIADPDVINHQPIVDDGEECICLVVTDGPIHLHSFIARMVQPFLTL